MYQKEMWYEIYVYSGTEIIYDDTCISMRALEVVREFAKMSKTFKFGGYSITTCDHINNVGAGDMVSWLMDDKNHKYFTV